jgi:hypothetical protein
MFRKALLTVAAIATIGSAALAPTSASASYYGWHGFHAKHYGHHYGCFRTKRVWTHYGWRWVRVNVCY